MGESADLALDPAPAVEFTATMKGTWLVVVLLATLVACGSKKNSAEATGASAASGGATRSTSEVAKRGLAALPVGTFAVAYFDPGMPFFDFVTKGLFLPMSNDAHVAFDKELTEFVTQRLGLDVSGVATVVGFAMAGEGPQVAVILPGVKGELRGASDEDGIAYRALPDGIAALVGETAVVGQGTAVRAAVAVLQGKADGFGKANPEVMAELLAETDGAFVGGMVLPGELPLPEPKALAKQYGIERVFVQFGKRGLYAVAKGEAKGLEQVANLAAAGLDAASRQLDVMHGVASDAEAPFEAGLTAILQYHLGTAGIAAARPVLEGNALKVEIPISMAEVPGIVAVVGMLAAIAIPAFMKYIKRSKAMEAKMMLRKMADGARMLALEGVRMPPPGGPTPPLGSCCETGDKCLPDASLWESEPWVALQFSMDEPHYYSYQFVPGPNGFVVRAMGDLNCDGETSLFELEGQFDNGDVVLSDLHIVGETE